ncbi:hypothetical protein [Roseateles toxinivorans]|uniref:HD domain-containing protein n=1 Tax=Roseateles toxinivorans TaxID=270368 RepID=A0A4R6QEL6_9BURK|nr:hypothetical protein [Roseateles toxinivorans]TDP60446.1 hypothetical protein DES47_11646 [Roseateles toxinivorans]
MNISPKDFPFKTLDTSREVACVLGRGTVTSVLGQVLRVEHGWAGRRTCQLQLSIGTLSVETNREQLPEDVKPGQWLKLRLLQTHGKETPSPLSIKRAEPGVKMAWVPSSLYHRGAHMQALRCLLLRLEPEVQAAFMIAMADPQLQRRFFWRVAAADHHTYPGGLFDQSVRAAELAFGTLEGNPQATERERGLAVLLALFFDLGKTFDPVLSRDGSRAIAGLTAHRLSTHRLLRPLQRIERLNATMAEELRLLLNASELNVAALPAPLDRVTRAVHAAVKQSWTLEACDV